MFRERTPTTFRVPPSVRAGLLIGVVVLWAFAVVMAAIAILVMRSKNMTGAGWLLGWLPLLVAGFLAFLALYVTRDFRGKWGLRVTLDTDRASLDLPSGRMLIRRPPAQRLTLNYSEIAAVETRLEAYPTWRLVS